ncbi:hypothetical protein D3C86_857640 [compost metagenome]
MATFTMTDLVQAEQTLLGKMQENVRLRDEFVSNPREVILRELNIQVPQGLEVMPVEANEDALLVPIQAPGGIPARLPSLFSPELDQARSQLMQRLGTDPDFKSAFLSDTKGVIEREFGVSVPSSVEVQTVEVPANALMVVIPAAQSEDDELSETELEGYAGGKKKKVKIKSPIKIDVGKGGVSVGVSVPGTGIDANVSVGSGGLDASGHLPGGIGGSTHIDGSDFSGNVNINNGGIDVDFNAAGIGGSMNVGVGNDGVSAGAELSAGEIGVGANVGVGTSGVDAGIEGEAFGLDKGVGAHVGPDGASMGVDNLDGSYWNVSIDGQGIHGEGSQYGVTYGGSLTGDGVEGEGHLNHLGVGAEGSAGSGGVHGDVNGQPSVPNTPVPITPDVNYSGNK